MLTIEGIKRRIHSEWLWNAVKGLGGRRDLERVKEYIFKGLHDSEQRNMQRPHWGFFPGLTTQPWHDPGQLEWIRSLKESYESICIELEKVKTMKAEQGLYHKGWKVFYLQTLGPKSTKSGRLLCPNTTSLISSLPDGIGRAWFSALDPGGHVKPHYGNTNTRLRLHLGLITPHGCSIRVAQEERTWEKGGFLLFDDSFEHEVWNRGSSTRWILLLDLWHPDLTEIERNALNVLSTKRKAEYTKAAQDLESDAKAYESILKQTTN